LDYHVSFNSYESLVPHFLADLNIGTLIVKRYSLVSSLILCLGPIHCYKIKNVDYEVRAGLSSVYNDAERGWVADDIHSESASRTLDYACMSFFPS
jgi:hypothetical protein